MPSEHRPVQQTDLGGMRPEELRLMTKVARLYHEQGIRQSDIAERLHISQPRVSRLLKRAATSGLVRVTVLSAPGVHAELEDEITQRYGALDVVIADTADLDDEAALIPSIASAAANYLGTTLIGGERIGISSWSSVLLATVDAMGPRTGTGAEEVVQLIGGTGAAQTQAQATRLTGRLAMLTGAKPVYLPAPGLVASRGTRDALVGDPSIASTMKRYEHLTVLLAGIGSLSPSALLRASGNAVGESDEAALRAAAAVGDVCLRFFDASGAAVDCLNDRVVGIDEATLRAVPRRVGVAGGLRKRDAVRAALQGGWINVLVTDLHTAAYLAR